MADEESQSISMTMESEVAIHEEHIQKREVDTASQGAKKTLRNPRARRGRISQDAPKSESEARPKVDTTRAR